LGKQAVRKRRPGGGRKPSPTARTGAALSIRIRPETRGALEAEAAKSGKKISRVAEKLLEEGLQERSYRDSVSDPVRALAILIEDLENMSRARRADGGACEWSSDPTIFETFRIAISKLLEKLRPPGDIDTSADGPLIGRSPEQQAEAIFRAVWSNLQGAEPFMPSQAAAFFKQLAAREQLAGGGPTYGELAQLSQLANRLADVRKALNIKPDRSQEK
jgi:hypothetical protein